MVILSWKATSHKWDKPLPYLIRIYSLTMQRLTIKEFKNNSNTNQLLVHINLASSSLDKTLLRQIAKLLRACFS